MFFRKWYWITHRLCGHRRDEQMNIATIVTSSRGGWKTKRIFPWQIHRPMLSSVPTQGKLLNSCCIQWVSSSHSSCNSSNIIIDLITFLFNQLFKRRYNPIDICWHRFYEHLRNRLRYTLHQVLSYFSRRVNWFNKMNFSRFFRANI